MSDILKNREIFQLVQDIVNQYKIKENVLKNAEELSTQLTQRPSSKSEQVPKISLDSEDERDQFLLVLDFLRSSNYLFAEPTFQYESQLPDIKLDRNDLANRLGLDASNKDPLLIQLVRNQLPTEDICA